MGIVHHQPGIVTLLEAHQLWQGGHVAVHAEHPVGDDQPLPFAVGRLTRHQLLEGPDISMRIDNGAGCRKPTPVDNRGVVEAVGEDNVIRTEQPLQDTGIGGISGIEHQRRLCSLEGGDAFFEAVVQAHAAGDKAAGAAAGAELPRRATRFLDQAGMVGQAEVVIGTEQEVVAAVDRHVRFLGAIDGPQGAKHVGGAQLRQLCLQLIHEGLRSSDAAPKSPPVR